MKVTEITVTHSLTINLGNYESERVEITQTVALDSKDDPKEVRETLLKDIRKALYKEEELVLDTFSKRQRLDDRK